METKITLTLWLDQMSVDQLAALHHAVHFQADSGALVAIADEGLTRFGPLYNEWRDRDFASSDWLAVQRLNEQTIMNLVEKIALLEDEIKSTARELRQHDTLSAARIDYWQRLAKLNAATIRRLKAFAHIVINDRRVPSGTFDELYNLIITAGDVAADAQRGAIVETFISGGEDAPTD
jgi:hypothetical protein